METPVRILQVVNSLHFGGLQSFIINLYHNMDRRQIQFDFIVIPESEIGLYDEAKQMGARIYVCPRYKFVNYFSYIAWWNRFFQMHPEYKVIHGHVRSTSAIYLSIAKKYGLKTIAHSHSTSNGNGFLGIIKTLMQYRTRYIADYMFACSDIAGQWMFGKKTLNKSNYRMIPNGIDLKRFEYSVEKRNAIRKAIGVKDKDFLIGHIGRFTIPKNHIFLVNLFAAYLEKYPDSCLLMVGDGELWDTVKKECQKLHILDRVIMPGAKSNTEEYYQAMDVFVFPSLWEGLPVTVVEAQASGLPCIISDTITKEVKLTTLVKYLSLKRESDWIETIEKYRKRKREGCEHKDLLMLNKFDSQRVAAELSSFYLDLYKERKNYGKIFDEIG